MPSYIICNINKKNTNLEETRYYISFKQLFFSLKFQYNFVIMSNDSFKDKSNKSKNDKVGMIF